MNCLGLSPSLMPVPVTYRSHCSMNVIHPSFQYLVGNLWPLELFSFLGAMGGLYGCLVDHYVGVEQGYCDCDFPILDCLATSDQLAEHLWHFYLLFIYS